MAVRPILKFPSAKLRALSEPITDIDDGIRQLVSDMAETMRAADGAGLAAIQVGAPVRLFIIEGFVAGLGDAEDTPPLVLINPEITEISDESQTGDEGCLSFPGIFVQVKRGMRAKAKAQDLDGNWFEIEGNELFARALQHENDHLNGRLLIDQVGPIKREMIKRKLKKDAEAAARDKADEAEDAADRDRAAADAARPVRAASGR